MALIVLVNILPYREPDDVILGYDVWGFVGVGIVLAVLLWVSALHPKPGGGFFSPILTAAGGLAALGFIVHGLTSGDLGEGYYVLVIGLLMAAAAGVIRYPPESEQNGLPAGNNHCAPTRFPAGEDHA